MFEVMKTIQNMMVGFVSFIVNKKCKVSWVILIISLLLIAVSVYLVCNT
jgi:hypothetical protein